MAKIKEIELWQVAEIAGANRAVRGTDNYLKYQMQAEFKSGSGWKFFGWGVPGIPKNSKIYVKKNPTGDYLYINYLNGDVDRYLLNDAVKNLMNIL